MTTTPQPGAWYISRDGYATRVRVTHVTPDHVTVEWHDGWGKPRTADLTHRQIATTYRPLDPDVHVLLAAVAQRDADLAQARRRIAEEADAAGTARAQVFDLSALVREAAEVLAEFVRDSTDPGTAALGLLYRLRHADTAPATTTETDR